VVVFSFLPCLAYPADLANEGRGLAVDGCSACHQVTPRQKRPEPVFDPDQARSVPAPSFAAIARKYHGRPAALARFIRDPKHPMREGDWDERDLEAVVAFIQSLSR
jgi:cytochrome c551/c552